MLWKESAHGIHLGIFLPRSDCVCDLSGSESLCTALHIPVLEPLDLPHANHAALNKLISSCQYAYLGRICKMINSSNNHLKAQAILVLPLISVCLDPSNSIILRLSLSTIKNKLLQPFPFHNVDGQCKWYKNKIHGICL